MNEKIEIHSLAKLFPLASEEEIDRMAEDMKMRGLLNPIITLDGKVLDGRNRIAACKKAGIEPRFEKYSGKDPLGDVIAWNLHRRHLSTGQKAALAIEIKPLYEAQAKERQRAAQNNDTGRAVKAKLPEQKEGQSRDQAADVCGVSGRTVSDAEMVKEEDPDLFESVKAGTMSVNEAARSIKRKKNKKKVESAQKNPQTAKHGELPDLILADPPWLYEDCKTESRRIENKYATATIEEIKKHSPKTKADACLFLWATAPKLEEAIGILNAWGFKYRTCAVWDKQKIGMGYWFRGQHELLLVGVKGKAEATPESERVSSIFSESRKGHSEKPECVYAWIERAFPGKVKLEMYARNARDGWQSWGAEA